MAEQSYEGGCLCGRIRYRASGPPHRPHYCHCRMCQRGVGAPLTAWVNFPLEGSVLTEIVFAWPGLGFYITNSLLNADMNAVLGGTIVVGCVFIGLNLLSDLVYRVLDPRAR